MSLQNNEGLGTPAEPFEYRFLVDDLSDAFLQNVGACAMRMPDLIRPWDVILAGTVDVQKVRSEIIVSQRATTEYLGLQAPRDEEVSYLMQFRHGKYRAICLVAEGCARHVQAGMPALSSDYVMFYRAIMRSSDVNWSADLAEKEAKSVDPYLGARIYDKGRPPA